MKRFYSLQLVTDFEREPVANRLLCREWGAGHETGLLLPVVIPAGRNRAHRN